MKISTKLLLLILISTITNVSQAIVIRHDIDDEKYHADQSDFPPLATFYIDGAHGTLIAPTWIITAAHATFCTEPDAYAMINNQPRKIKNRYIHPLYTPEKSHDIALIELVAPVTDVAPAQLFKETTELSMNTWFIGIGGTGNGLTGQVLDNAQNNGVLRKAQNSVSEADGPLIKFTFERGNNALPLEGVSGGGDSGGPAYVETDNGYQLLGVSSRFEGSALGKYGITEIYSRISYFNDWILQIINNNEQTQLNLYQAELSVAQLPAGLSKETLPSICQQIGVRPK